jgi:hypothetical protein
MRERRWWAFSASCLAHYVLVQPDKTLLADPKRIFMCGSQCAIYYAARADQNLHNFDGGASSILLPHILMNPAHVTFSGLADL